MYFNKEFVFISFLLLSCVCAYDPDFEVPDEYLPNWDKYQEFLADMEEQVKKFDVKIHKNKDTASKETSKDDVTDRPTDKNQDIKTDKTDKQITNTIENECEDNLREECNGDFEKGINFIGPVNGKGTVSIAANFGCGSPNLTPNSPFGPSWITTTFCQPCPPLFCPYCYLFHSEDEHKSSNYEMHSDLPSSFNYPTFQDWPSFWPSSRYWDEEIAPERSGRIKIIDGETGKEFDDDVVIQLYVEGRKHPVEDEVIVEAAAPVKNVFFNGLVPATGSVKIAGQF